MKNNPEENWKRRIPAILYSGLLIFLLTSSEVYSQSAAIPYLRRQGTATQLVVEGKPFLIRGGELGNSSASSIEYMKPIWGKLAAMNLNTVVIPVYWELIEPVEGKYDFSLVDDLILAARKNNLKLVPLWFGAWKNSMSSYVPAWVKKNQKRFPRSQTKDGKGMEILSPFDEENVKADAKAFQALMRHLKEFDERQQTVILVQVENEIGMIPDSRDRSQIADKLYSSPVPAEFINYLQKNKENLIPEFRAVWQNAGFKTSGTWEEVFGKGIGTEEIFMAWHFAVYTNRVTAAGKDAYALPMYVNAALIRPGYQPGQYPSAGPLPHLMDIWRAGAPKIDFLSPDIYFPNVAEWIRKFDRAGNPIFVPEIMLSQLNAAQALYTVAEHDAIGFSPFSIESAEDETKNNLTAGYDILSQLTPLILENQGKEKMIGLLPDSPDAQRIPQQKRLNGYTLSISYERPTSQNVSGGLVIAVAPDEFIIAGTSLVITFDADSPGEPLTGILSAQEGKFISRNWVGGRWLNGDQTHQGRHIRLEANKFTIQRVKLYRYR